MVVFAAIVFALLAQLSTSKALNAFLSKNVDAVHEKHLADLTEAHRRRVTGLKDEHSKETLRLRQDLNRANAKFEHLYADYEYITSMYQDQMRSAQEQEDRITYLETKLREAGQSTPASFPPFSAPASQLVFANPPPRKRSHSFSKSSGSPSPLSQVVEAEETEE
jgi:hypothetical protein